MLNSEQRLPWMTKVSLSARPPLTFVALIASLESSLTLARCTRAKRIPKINPPFERETTIPISTGEFQAHVAHLKQLAEHVRGSAGPTLCRIRASARQAQSIVPLQAPSQDSGGAVRRIPIRPPCCLAQ